MAASRASSACCRWRSAICFSARQTASRQRYGATATAASAHIAAEVAAHIACVTHIRTNIAAHIACVTRGIASEVTGFKLLSGRCARHTAKHC